MRRLNLVALASLVLVGMFLSSCGSDGEAVGENSAEVAAVAPLEMRSMLASRTESRLVATIRGPGQVGYIQPITRRDGGEMITTFRIKNISTGALAGFKVDEFWYDDNGDTVTGGSYRMRRPFLQDQIIEVSLRVPRDSRMARSNYEFTHQNGVVEANLFDEMEEPTPLEEEEETEESGGAETAAR